MPCSILLFQHTATEGNGLHSGDISAPCAPDGMEHQTFVMLVCFSLLLTCEKSRVCIRLH